MIHRYFEKSLVMLFEMDGTGKIVNQATGTLMRAESGRPVVLTAKHIFGSYSGQMHALTSVAAYHNVVAEVIRMPRLDIAIATLRDFARDLAEIALAPASIGDELAIRKGDTLIAAGYPERVTTTVHNHARGTTMQRHGYFIYPTVVAGVNREGISLVWTYGEMFDDQPHVYGAAGFPLRGRVEHRSQPASVVVWLGSSCLDARWRSGRPRKRSGSWECCRNSRTGTRLRFPLLDGGLG